jgi:penicillin amidase
LLAIAGRAAFTRLPKPSTVEQRLAAFPTTGLPIDGRLEIHWNDHQVPFVEAETDSDAAFALGLVHAHLRLGQLELMRRISQGRISEVAGPIMVDVDRAIRTIDYGRAAEAMEADFPRETHAWLTRFVAGINHYIERMEVEPHEFSILGLSREPWTIRDLITVGRLGSSDINWMIWFDLWPLRKRPDWPELWRELIEAGSGSLTSFPAKPHDHAMIAEIIGGYSKAGSNAFAVGPKWTGNGHALIASDPHLGLLLPNIWLLVGFKCPSYHAVGMMIPGIPFVAVGRNERIAWGGTNMRAATSDFFDVSSLGADEIKTQSEPIRVRWSRNAEFKSRITPHGPMISDIPMLKNGTDEAVALRWIGHNATDEFTSMLAVNRAQGWDEFRAAFRTFAVSAQNMIFADADGNIGQMMAVQVPARPNEVPPFLHKPEDSAWRHIVGSEALPTSFNPPQGYLASANNRPPETQIPVGYFFSTDDRVSRMSRLIEECGTVTVANASAIQLDVLQPSSLDVCEAVLEAVDRLNFQPSLTPVQQRIVDAIRGWDGHYTVESTNAVAYEAFLHNFIKGFYGRRFDDETLASFTSVSHLGVIVPRDIRAAADDELATVLRDALTAAATAFDKFQNWGDMHRVVVNHPFAMIPVVGARYRFADMPAPGSRQTVMKTNASPSDTKHRAGYGSQARHISDMSDLDANHFLLLGGQDGWFGSSTFKDQMPMWEKGEYIQVPMRLETVRREFRHKMMLRNGKG